MRSLEITRVAFLASRFDVVDFQDGTVIIESPEHQNFVGLWSPAQTKLTIKPMTISYEAFVQDKLLPWGKMYAIDLPARIADGVTILFEDVEFAAEEAEAELCLMM